MVFIKIAHTSRYCIQTSIQEWTSVQEVLHPDVGLNEGHLSADRVMRAKKRPAPAAAEGGGEKHHWKL